MLRALPLLVAVLQPPAAPPVAPPTPAVAATPAGDTTGEVGRGRRDRKPVRRTTLTPELERSAFADAAARTLLQRARVARLAQDSALLRYDARTYQRISVGMGLRRGPEKLLFRTESAARVGWTRGQGIRVRATGERTVIPMAKRGAEDDVSHGDDAPIPYFPGRETLWIPTTDTRVARASVDEEELIHPLAGGAEAYYRYATGDSISIRLPDGRRIALRELRITARRPEWRAFVGSFWFDVERGALVRAAYRLAADLDVWQLADEETRKEAEEAIAAGKKPDDDDEVPFWVKGMISPLRARLSAVTVEYGLYDGRFWLPRRHVAEAEGQAGFMRLPLRVEEGFRYDAVNAAAPQPAETAAPTIPALSLPRPTLAEARTTRDSARALAPSDSARRPGEDDDDRFVTVNLGFGGATIDVPDDAGRRAANVDEQLRRYAARADSLVKRAATARAKGDTADAAMFERRARGVRRRAATLAETAIACANAPAGATYDAGTQRREDGEVRVRVTRPCDPRADRSTDLPASPYEKGELLFGGADRDELLASLDLSLQPGWAPQPPQFRTGLAFLRFNRVEGLSVGGEGTAVLGKGYTAQATARLGLWDLVPNAELGLTRTDGRRDLGVRVFHRLAVANDDWGSPLGFGASTANALYGRDEGFYYRAWGAELTGVRSGTLGATTWGWRAFAERQRAARREATRGLFGPDFLPNVAAAEVTALGAGSELARGFGEDPRRTRVATRLRSEAAALSNRAAVTGDPSRDGWTGYGRLMGEATLTQPLGGVTLALTGGAGALAGDAPVQRLFYVGGLQTVRGQWAAPTNLGRGAPGPYVGNAFWLGRAELGTNRPGVRPTVFYDAGWAGDRDRFGTGRPMSGAGVGLALLDGLVRLDVARGIWPEKRVRVDLSLQARF